MASPGSGPGYHGVSGQSVGPVRIWSFSLHCSVTGTGFGDISYTWRKGLQLWDEGSVVVTVDKSSLDDREPLICTARNAVSSRSVIVTISGVQCSGPSMNTWVWIMVAGAGFLMGNLMLCICQEIYPDAMSWPGPELGLAMDQLGPVSGLALDQFKPVPGLAMDQHGPALCLWGPPDG
ncbi:hypothetical protein HGM15179_020589 [Zosterops borbonicus]|uniref:Ig-like domain-containing protein n=1 Tax=Zosterops borbonicus TaxID=364589 RepID=A0A8K1FXJ5_9PASS|nr:hypothetical protein HGM15179_020589 [Zosterops borbonicus]